MSAASSASTWIRRIGRNRLLVLGVLALLLAEIALGLVSVKVTSPGGAVAAYWPNSGLSIVALVLTARRWQPATLAGIFVAIGLANLLGGRDLQVAAGYAVANAAEAALALWLLTQGGEPERPGTGSAAALAQATALTTREPDADRRPRLESVDDFIRLFVACAFASALGAVLAGATIGLLLGGDAVAAGRTVFTSHLAAMLLIVPLSMRLPRTSEHAAGVLEVLLQWTTLALVIGAVFFGAEAMPLVFIIYPVLVWGALRAEPRVTALQLLVAGGVVAVLATTAAVPTQRDRRQRPADRDGRHPAAGPPDRLGPGDAAPRADEVAAPAGARGGHAQPRGARRDPGRDDRDAIIGIGLDGRVEYVNVGAEPSPATGHASCWDGQR